MARKSISKE